MNNIQTRPIVGNVQQTIQTFIDKFEAYSSFAYWDTADPSQPTIGLGTNLNERNYFMLAVQELYGTSVNASAFYSAFQSGQRSIQPTPTQVLQQTAGNHPYNDQLQALLNNLVTQFVGPSAQLFQPTPYQQSLIEMQILNGFTVGGKAYQGAIADLQNLLQTNNISIQSNTVEFEALISMYYNHPNNIGSGLLKALGPNGSRAEAWYEIRYRTNKAQSNGIADRRVAESDKFGLYNEQPGQPIPPDEAVSVLQMYTQHRTNILSYEQKFSDPVWWPRLCGPSAPGVSQSARV